MVDSVTTFIILDWVSFEVLAEALRVDPDGTNVCMIGKYLLWVFHLYSLYLVDNVLIYLFSLLKKIIVIICH